MILYPTIEPGKTLDSLAGARIIDTGDRLVGLEPVAIVTMYWQVDKKIEQFARVDDKGVRLLHDEGDTKEGMQVIGRAGFYSHTELKGRLGDQRPTGYSHIILVGMDPKCDLRPVALDSKNREIRDDGVQKYQCVISYDPVGNHIQISNLIQEATSCIYLNNRPFTDTRHWRPGDRVEMGAIIPTRNHDRISRMTLLDYSITDHGVKMGVNRPRRTTTHVQGPGGLNYVVFAGIL